MSSYIETKVRYNKQNESGVSKRTDEYYLVNAMSFTEAEARIIKEIEQYTNNDYNVSAVRKSRISEIFFNSDAERYYHVKLGLITIDEKTGVEKRKASHILVQADNLKSAYDKFAEQMQGTLVDYEIISISETGIVDVLDAESK